MCFRCFSFLLQSLHISQEPIDHPDGPTDPQRDTAVSSSSDGTGGGGSPGTAAAPSGGLGPSAAASEVSYTDDAAPSAGEQPLDLVQACMIHWNTLRIHLSPLF